MRGLMQVSGRGACADRGRKLHLWPLPNRPTCAAQQAAQIPGHPPRHRRIRLQRRSSSRRPFRRLAATPSPRSGVGPAHSLPRAGLLPLAAVAAACPALPPAIGTGTAIAIAASMKLVKSGCPPRGRDLNSGWNWHATHQG